MWYDRHTMVLAALLLAAATLADLEVALQPAPGRLTVQMAVGSKLPDDWTQALSAGAPVSITYRLRLYRNRRWLWDLRLASHELVVKAQRDPLTGVFSLVVGDRRGDPRLGAGGLARGGDLLGHPPPDRGARVPLRHEPLWLFVRAEFLTRYKLLVIPSTVGTDWVQKAVPESP